MTTDRPSTPPPPAAIPPDDPARQATIARPDADDALPHVAVAGNTYTVVLSGEQTAGRYALIDMHVAPDGGPPPHRHDFEESFTVLEGEIEVTFRGERSVVRAGETVHVPANAPHAFTNRSGRHARLLCLCAPAGQERFFLEVGDRVATRTTPPPPLDDATRAARREKARELAAQYRTEFVPPG